MAKRMLMQVVSRTDSGEGVVWGIGDVIEIRTSPNPEPEYFQVTQVTGGPFDAITTLKEISKNDAQSP